MPPMTRPGPGPARPHRPQIKPWERRRRRAAAAAAVNVSPVIRPKGTFKRGRGRPPGKAACRRAILWDENAPVQTNTRCSQHRVIEGRRARGR